MTMQALGHYAARHPVRFVATVVALALVLGGLGAGLVLAKRQGDQRRAEKKLCHQMGYRWWSEREQCVQYIDLPPVRAGAERRNR